jgi:hypothetical protein
MKFLTLLSAFVFCLSVSALAQQDTLQQYAGKYKFPEGSPVTEVEVVYADGALSMNSAAGSSALRFEKGDEFTIVSFNGTAVFTRNADKKIIGVHVEVMGTVLDGTKEETKGWNTTKGIFPLFEPAYYVSSLPSSWLMPLQQ